MPSSPPGRSVTSTYLLVELTTIATVLGEIGRHELAAMVAGIHSNLAVGTKWPRGIIDGQRYLAGTMSQLGEKRWDELVSKGEMMPTLDVIKIIDQALQELDSAANENREEES